MKKTSELVERFQRYVTPDMMDDDDLYDEYRLMDKKYFDIDYHMTRQDLIYLAVLANELKNRKYFQTFDELIEKYIK